MRDKKCKRNVLADNNIVEALWKIVEPDQNVRLRNAEIIVNTLKGKQPTYKDGEIFPDLEYTLKRLITGLASSRKAARQGFAVTLTEILRCFGETLHPNHIISLIFKWIPLSNITGERHAAIIGQILAFQAVVCSERLLESPSCLPTVLETILQLSNKKSYVEHAACLVIQELLTRTPPEVCKVHLWPVLESRVLRSGWDACSPQELWLLFVCRRLFPELVDEDFLQAHWDTSKPYSPETFPLIAKLLKKSTLVHPLVHPLCTEIIQQVAQHKKKVFKEFWNIVINDTLLGLYQFEEAYLVFELVKLTLPQLKTAKYVKYVLSTKLCELLIRSVKTRHSPLYSAASQLCDFLVDYAGKLENPQVQFSVLKAFIFPPGTLLFDQVTKKNSVQTLVTKLKIEALKEYEEVLCNALLSESLEENEINLNESLKPHAAQQLCRLSNHPLAEGDWKSGILQQLFLHGFFSILKVSEDIPWCSQRVELPEPVKEACRQSFSQGLKLLQNPPLKIGFWSRFRHQRDVLSQLLDYVQLLLESPEVVRPVFDLDSVKESWYSMHSVVKKVRRWSAKAEENDRQSSIFQIFYLQIAFQLFYDLGNTERVLNELNECCKRSLKTWRHSQRQTEKKTDPDEPHWVDVITDLMLSMLSDKSPFVRGIVNSVFPAVCPYFTVDSVKLLIEAFNPKSEEYPLSEENEDEDEEVSFESGSSSDSDEDEEGVNGEVTLVDEEFRGHVKAALGDAAENSDEEEKIVSDSEMFKLDNAIAEAFRMRMKQSKKDKLKDEEAQTHFRLRCLELVEKFVKSEMRLQLALNLVEPLVATTKKGLANQKLESLATKSCNILRMLANTKKFKDKDDVQMEDLQSLLKSLLATAQKVSDSKFKIVLTQLCSFIIGCTQNLEPSTKANLKRRSALSKWYLELCKGLLENHFDKGTSYWNSQLFDHLFLACEEQVWELFDSLQATAFQMTTRLFKRTQAFSLLASILKISKQSVNIEDTSRMKELCSDLITKSIGALQEMVKLGVKPTYVSNLLLLLHLILQRHRPEPAENPAIEKELLQAVQKIPLKKLDNGGKKASRKIQALLQSSGPNPGKKMKRKRTSNSVCSASEEIERKVFRDKNG